MSRSSVRRRAVCRRFQRVKTKKFPGSSIIPCVVAQECLSLHRNRELRLSDWALSSAGSERLPYKQRVGGSNPSAPTIIYYGIQIAAIHLLMSCCCFVLCSRWKGRGKSSALAGRWWSKGERTCAGSRKPCDRVRKCPISFGRREGKERGARRGWKNKTTFAEKWTPFREKQWGNKEKYTVVICLFAQQEKADHRFRL